MHLHCQAYNAHPIAINYYGITLLFSSQLEASNTKLMIPKKEMY